MVQFWLFAGTEGMRLPVPPAEFEVQTGNLNETIVLHELGEVNLAGKSKLKTISLSSFFPLRYSRLCQYSPIPSPRTCLDRIERWRMRGQPIRLLITGNAFTFSQTMLIENFSYMQKRGPEDVYFTLELKEHRSIKAKAPAGSSAVTRSVEGKNAVTTYTVKPKDTLWGIAKKLYGDSSRWRELKQKNKVKDEHKLAIGTVLVV